MVTVGKISDHGLDKAEKDDEDPDLDLDIVFLHDYLCISCPGSIKPENQQCSRH